MHAGRALPFRASLQPAVCLQRPVRHKEGIAGFIQAADVWGI